MLSIIQNKTGYRSSIDSFLLAAFATVKSTDLIMDFGAGNGILAVLLGKEYPGVKVKGLELQAGLVSTARQNVADNGLKDQIEIVEGDIKACQEYFSPHSFDLVISNPPYRKVRSGRINPNEEKALARHEVTIDLDQFISNAAYLLKPKGRLAIIYPPGRLDELLLLLTQYNLALRRLRFVHSFIKSTARMVLVESVKGVRSDPKIEPPLIIYEKESQYSEECKGLYGRWGLSA